MGGRRWVQTEFQEHFHEESGGYTEIRGGTMFSKRSRTMLIVGLVLAVSLVVSGVAFTLTLKPDLAGL